MLFWGVFFKSIFMQDKILKRQTNLPANILLFCRFLRGKGYKIGPTEIADVLKAVNLLSIYSENDFKTALKTILAKSKRQQVLFNDFYDEFWNELKRALDSKTKMIQSKKKTPSKPKKPSFETLNDWLNGKKSNDEKDLDAYSDIETLAKKDFANLSEEEMRLMMSLLQKIAKKIAHRKSRLRKASKKARQIDLKRTIRKNLRNGVEINQFVYSEPKQKKVNLVILADSSKSMDMYSRFFIHLVYAFQNAYDKIETFTFNTSLFHITEILERYDFQMAFDIIAERIPQWSGGTKIGFSFHQFLENYAHKTLRKKTIVFILSDGWDTGNPDLLTQSMKAIQQKCKKVIWLNPLSGNASYSAEVTGLKAAMPYIDVFAPAHNLESLRTALKNI